MSADSKAAVQAYLNDTKKMDELVKKTHPGGKVKLSTIIPALKEIIKSEDASQTVPSEKKKAFEKKYFIDRGHEEMDEAGYRQFLKEMMTEFVNAA